MTTRNNTDHKRLRVVCSAVAEEVGQYHTSFLERMLIIVECADRASKFRLDLCTQLSSGYSALSVCNTLLSRFNFYIEHTVNSLVFIWVA